MSKFDFEDGVPNPFKGELIDESLKLLGVGKGFVNNGEKGVDGGLLLAGGEENECIWLFFNSLASGKG